MIKKQNLTFSETFFSMKKSRWYFWNPKFWRFGDFYLIFYWFSIESSYGSHLSGLHKRTLHRLLPIENLLDPLTIFTAYSATKVRGDLTHLNLDNFLKNIETFAIDHVIKYQTSPKINISPPLGPNIPPQHPRAAIRSCSKILFLQNRNCQDFSSVLLPLLLNSDWSEAFRSQTFM